jgi:hypothetical protein
VGDEIEHFVIGIAGGDYNGAYNGQAGLPVVLVEQLAEEGFEMHLGERMGSEHTKAVLKLGGRLVRCRCCRR